MAYGRHHADASTYSTSSGTRQTHTGPYATSGGVLAAGGDVCCYCSAAKTIIRSTTHLSALRRLDTRRVRTTIDVWNQCGALIGGDPSLGLGPALASIVRASAIPAHTRTHSHAHPHTHGFSLSLGGEGCVCGAERLMRGNQPLDALGVLDVEGAENACNAWACVIDGRIRLQCNSLMATHFRSAKEWEGTVLEEEILPVLAWASLLDNGEAREALYDMITATGLGIPVQRNDGHKIHSTASEPLVLPWRTRTGSTVDCIVQFRADVAPSSRSSIFSLRLVPLSPLPPSARPHSFTPPITISNSTPKYTLKGFDAICQPSRSVWSSPLPPSSAKTTSASSSSTLLTSATKMRVLSTSPSTPSTPPVPDITSIGNSRTLSPFPTAPDTPLPLPSPLPLPLELPLLQRQVTLR